MNTVRETSFIFLLLFSLHSNLADHATYLLRCKDDAIQKHERIVALPTPNNDQRQLVSEYIWNDDLNGGRGAFLSPELRGDNPEMYREEWLEDLVVFEHVAESMDGFARWVTQPLLEAAHFCCLGRAKVRYMLFSFSGGVQVFHISQLEDGQIGSDVNQVVGGLSECSCFKSSQTKYELTMASVEVPLIC